MTVTYSHAPVTATVTTAGLLFPILLLVGVPQPAKALLAAALLGFVPGYALVRFAPPHDSVLVRLILSIAISLALATVVSSALLYLGVWSWHLCAGLLGGVTVGAGLLRWRRTE
jgi:uncharacterized membrane protein